MTAADERTLDRLSSDALRAGDRVQQVFQGEFGTNSRYFTVKRMVERQIGWYVVTEGEQDRALYWDGAIWRTSPTTSYDVVEIDEAVATNRWLGR